MCGSPRSKAHRRRSTNIDIATLLTMAHAPTPLAAFAVLVSLIGGSNATPLQAPAVAHGRRLAVQGTVALANARNWPLQGAAAAFAALVSRQVRAENEIMRTIHELDNGGASSSDADYWSRNAPRFSALLAAPLQMQFVLEAPRDSEVEYLWVRRVDPLFNPSRDRSRHIAHAEKCKPGRQAVLSAMLPAGTYTATAWSRRHGMWNSSPFTIGHDRMED